MKQKRKETELSYVLGRIAEEANSGRTRVVLVVNSRSSQAKRVETEAIKPIKNRRFLVNLVF